MMTDKGTDKHPRNYIRIHRRRTGLSQREMSEMLGYANENALARHERLHTVPTLRVAVAYEVIFRVPVSEIFAELRDDVAKVVEPRLTQLEDRLGQRSARDRDAMATARKLMWLSERRNPEYDAVS